MCVGPHSGVMLGRAELQGLGGVCVSPPAGLNRLQSSAEFVVSCSEEKELFAGQKLAEKYLGLPRRSRRLPGTGVGGSAANTWGWGQLGGSIQHEWGGASSVPEPPALPFLQGV